MRRFRQEIQAAAQLSHPNIVLAYHAEQIGGRHVLAMEFCEGMDLSRLVRRHGPLSVGVACHYLRQAALGLEHAHARGLVHRDVKPSNLLATGDTVKILDLGLARWSFGETGAAGQASTSECQIMGTPDFVAPEQAANPRAADTRSDLYGLGCTAYYLLTGQAPFPGGSVVEKILRHRLEEPVALERHCADLPPPVANLVRKLMAKEPAQRCQSALEVAAEWAPFASTDGLAEVVSARPEAWAGTDLEPRTPSAPPFETHVTPPRHGQPVSTVAYEAQMLGKPRWAWAASVAGVAAVAAVAVGFAISRLPDPVRPGADSARPSLSAAIESKPVPRRWHAASVLVPNPSHVFGIAVGSDSRTLAVACGDLDDPDKPGAIKVWDLDTLQGEVLSGHAAAVQCVAFSHDGTTLASGTGNWDQEVTGEVKLWDVAGWKERLTFAGNSGGVFAVAFAPNGQVLATAGRDKKATLWELSPGGARRRCDLVGHTGMVNSVAFSHDGELLATGSQDGTLKLWKADAGTDLGALVGRGGGRISCVAFSHDDKLLAAGLGVVQGTMPQVQLWDVQTRELVAELNHDQHHVLCVAFAPDGKTLATGCADGVGWLWDVDTKSKLQTLTYHHQPLMSLAFSPDGQKLITGGTDGNVMVWVGGEK